MPRLDEDPDWASLTEEERELLRALAEELGMVFPSDEDDLSYE